MDFQKATPYFQNKYKVIVMQVTKNYTPGPWHAKDKTADIFCEGHHHIASAYLGNNRVQSSSPHSEFIENRRKNALLISAAPELAEALIGMAKLACIYHHKTLGMTLTNSQLKKLWPSFLSPESRAALVKAGVITD